MNGMVGPMGVMKHGNSHDGMVGLMQYLSMVDMLCEMWTWSSTWREHHMIIKYNPTYYC